MWSRLYKAWTYAWDGLVNGVKTERAIRQEICLFLTLLPFVFLIPIPFEMRMGLLSSMMLVLIVEFLNTAIEKTVDYVSLDVHPIAKKIKDWASAAVFLSLVNAAMWWGAVLWSFWS